MGRHDSDPASFMPLKSLSAKEERPEPDYTMTVLTNYFPEFNLN
jgi:hypothetical protein